MASKLKTVKVSEETHKALKVFVAEFKMKNMSGFVDVAIYEAIRRHTKLFKDGYGFDSEEGGGKSSPF